MAALLNPAFLYVGSDRYNAITPWAALAPIAAGAIGRPLTAPAAGSERAYVATTGGTTGAAEPVWTFTKGAIQPTDGSVVWQEVTGQPAVNGDVTNTIGWTAGAKANTVALGQIIKRDNAASYQICTVAGTAGSGAEPAFSDTAGVPTADNTVTWVSLGLVGSFGAFAAPHIRILNADAATWQTIAGGNDVYVSSGHNYSVAAALTYAGGLGTAAKPNRYLCVPNNVAPPAAGSVTTGATESTTGANSIAVTKFGYYDGVQLIAGDAANSASINIANTNAVSDALSFNNLTMKLGNTNAASRINFGCRANTIADSFIRINNPTYIFGATGQFVSLGGGLMETIGGTFAATGSIPTLAFAFSGGNAAITLANIRGLDVSTVVGTLIGGLNTNMVAGATFTDCKLGAAVTITSGAPVSAGGCFVRMHNCDSGTKNYRHYETNYLGTGQSETTIVNNAGASDGVTIQSVNIATSANTTFYQPYQYQEEFCVWNDTVGSPVTMNVEIAGANQLTNGDAWLETEYMGSAATPVSSVVSNRKADSLTGNTNIPASAATWGGAPAFKQTLSNTFTPQMKGWVKGRVFAARPSTQFYVDPPKAVA